MCIPNQHTTVLLQNFIGCLSVYFEVQETKVNIGVACWETLETGLEDAVVLECDTLVK